MKRINNIKIYEDLDNNSLIKHICKKYHILYEDILDWHIIKKSIDARNKDNIHYLYNIAISFKSEKKYSKFDDYKKFELPNINIKNNNIERPVIVGAGPAGLFAALTFIKNGIKPIIIEQGKKVEERKKDVDNFMKTGILNLNSNVQFGEGGAGTFSDGKLTTGVNNPIGRVVLKEFVNFGAPKQIMYINKPHIGTDNLIKIISNMRNYIIKMGGEFFFEEKFIDFEIENKKLVSILSKKICTKKEEYRKIETDTLVLAIGHSARDTFEKIYEKGLNIEKKNFSVGVRIEHKQEMINKSQYGENTKLRLPPAEYKLAYHGEKRSCYTFCMCPGGVVMASSSGENEIVTNGMSTFARDGENANSAVLVNITPEDFEGNSPLEGIYFQKELEKKAFILGGSNFYAPIQKFGDFLENRKTEKLGKVKPTYKPGVTFANLQEILPQYVTETLKEGILDFDKKIKGFADEDSILTGVETRTSSPVRIVRDETLQSNIKGIYPCGEGAGYAGGITTAAMDGIKCAIKILESN